VTSVINSRPFASEKIHPMGDVGMTTATGVFLPDESEQQPRKKSPQSVHANARGSAGAEPAKTDYSELGKLGEHELKAAIKSEWKKHEESARADLAPLLYFLRERLRAQGARNDLANADRGFAAWVEENLDISRRTADRWCDWFALEAGLKEKPTSGHPSKSDDEGFYDVIITDHKGEAQIAFNCWVKTTVHAQFTRALVRLQKQLNLKNKKEAMVQGVIYAAKVLTGGKRKIDTRLSPSSARKSSLATRKSSLSRRAQGAPRHKQDIHGSLGHRGGSGPKVMRAAAGR
jgi:hypothetical protein